MVLLTRYTPNATILLQSLPGIVWGVENALFDKDEPKEVKKEMKYKHCCVVDAYGVYKTFVLVIIRNNPREDSSVTSEAEVQYYAMLPGESLIETKPPSMRLHAGTLGFVNPKWDEDSNSWTEGATDEKIAAWEAEHPAPEMPEPQPSTDEILDILLGVS